MGCISSKIMSRAVSFHEDRLNYNRSQRKSNGVPPLLEDLIMFTSTPRPTTTAAATATDQLLSNLLLSSSSSNSSTANKLQTELGFNFPSSLNAFPKPATVVEPQPLPPPSTHAVNASELMEGLEHAVLHQPQESSLSATVLGVVDDDGDGDGDVVHKKSKRSKSCPWLADDPDIESLNEGELNELGNRDRAVRFRSFHTVEEYDALVQKIWLSSSRIPINDDYRSAPQPFESSMSQQHPNQSDVDDTQETARSPWLMHKQQHLLRDDNTHVTEGGIGIRPCLLDSSGMIEESPTNTSGNSKEDKGVVTERRICEKGLRRKAIAKGLDSLKIPDNSTSTTSTTSIEFPTNLRKWGHVEGQVYSPGASSYVTPKFGSYNVSSSSSSRSGLMGKEYYRRGNEEEGIMLNPELVAAFEECMQQLQLEEESLLKQIETNAIVNKEAQEDDIIKAD